MSWENRHIILAVTTGALLALTVQRLGRDYLSDNDDAIPLLSRRRLSRHFSMFRAITLSEDDKENEDEEVDPKTSQNDIHPPLPLYHNHSYHKSHSHPRSHSYLFHNSDEIPSGIESTISDTPLFLIHSLSAFAGCSIYGKAEFLNGAGNSPKDRVALSIITTAEAAGLLRPHSGDTVYEGTVGSTGISLATLCRARGYKAHIVMPSDQAREKSDLLLKLGAEVERVTPAPIVDKKHFVNIARIRAEEHTHDQHREGRGFFANQFETDANWRAHYEGTGPEIWAQTGHKLDAFVSGAGTGGTISGVGKFLKEVNPDIQIVLADPQGSGAYNKIKHGVMFHALEKEGTRRRDQVDSVVEGIGLTRSTRNFEVGVELIDDAVKVSDQQARMMARWLVENDGVFVGSSSAVNCVAAVKTALELGPGHHIATLLCDSGIRHLSKFWAQIGEVGGDAKVSMDDILQGRDVTLNFYQGPKSSSSESSILTPRSVRLPAIS